MARSGYTGNGCTPNGGVCGGPSECCSFDCRQGICWDSKRKNPNQTRSGGGRRQDGNNPYQTSRGRDCDLDLPHVWLWGTCYDIGNTTSLDLRNSGLNTPINGQIGNLVNLEYLDLSLNNINGGIPSSIGNLTNLTQLNLGSNQLTGEIPVEIGNLTNLEYLYLSNNQLEGGIPSSLANLTVLNTLTLEHNDLTGELPPGVGNMHMNWNGLVTLALSYNQLSGQIPSEVCEANGIPQLYVRDNRFCPPYPDCIEFIGDQDTSLCGNGGSGSSQCDAMVTGPCLNPATGCSDHEYEMYCCTYNCGGSWCSQWYNQGNSCTTGAGGGSGISKASRSIAPRGRGMARGGKVNSGRFSGRTQNNPKGKPRK